MSHSILLDAVFGYQQAVLAKTYRALSQTHGEAFATYLVDEFRAQVMQSAKTRLCGHSEAGLLQETTRLNGHQHTDPTIPENNQG